MRETNIFCNFMPTNKTPNNALPINNEKREWSCKKINRDTV